MTPWRLKWQPLKPNSGSGMWMLTECAGWRAGAGSRTPSLNLLAPTQSRRNYVELVSQPFLPFQFSRLYTELSRWQFDVSEVIREPEASARRGRPVTHAGRRQGQ